MTIDIRDDYDDYDGGYHNLDDAAITEVTAPPRPPGSTCGAKYPGRPIIGDTICTRFTDHDGPHRGYGFSITAPVAWTDAEARALWLDAEATWREQVPVWLDAEATWWREEVPPWLEAEDSWLEEVATWLEAEAIWRWLDAEATWLWLQAEDTFWREEIGAGDGGLPTPMQLWHWRAGAWLEAEATWRKEQDQ